MKLSEIERVELRELSYGHRSLRESDEERLERRKKLRALIRQVEKRISDEERQVANFERNSRAPFEGLQGNHEMVDVEILSGFADPDEIENEERINKHYHRRYIRADDVEAGSDELFDRVPECDCEEEDQCIICCTQRDLLDIPVSLFRVIEEQKRTAGSFLTIQMPTEMAHVFGFV